MYHDVNFLMLIGIYQAFIYITVVVIIIHYKLEKLKNHYFLNPLSLNIFF